jgi:RNA polymerase sigma-70 factor (ECF subfamily)
MGDPDLTLFDRWIAGDQAAGNDLFKRHFEGLYRFFDQKTNGDADDLVQETFAECLKGTATFRRQASFRTYLFAIARNVLFGHWRRAATARPTLDFDEISIESLSTSVGSRIARRQEQSRLHAAMRTLALEQQILLDLHYFQDLDAAQLAEVFDVEPTTIRTRLFRARQVLQGLLDSGASAETFDAWAKTSAEHTS